MDKFIDGGNAQSIRMIKTSPEALRQLATRLELQAREATLPGEVVTYAFTRNLLFVYEPEVSHDRAVMSFHLTGDLVEEPTAGDK